LDEQIPPALAEALRNRGIDVTTTADAGLIGTGDREHLEFAANAGRVVITQDVDFLRLHSEGTSHAGIAFWRQQTRSIGEALRRLLLIHATMSPDEMFESRRAVVRDDQLGVGANRRSQDMTVSGIVRHRVDDRFEALDPRFGEMPVQFLLAAASLLGRHSLESYTGGED
jgi:predicted nuclease of predicted toxin-antitoxin system